MTSGGLSPGIELGLVLIHVNAPTAGGTTASGVTATPTRLTKTTHSCLCAVEDESRY